MYSEQRQALLWRWRRCTGWETVRQRGFMVKVSLPGLNETFPLLPSASPPSRVSVMCSSVSRSPCGPALH